MRVVWTGGEGRSQSKKARKRRLCQVPRPLSNRGRVLEYVLYSTYFVRTRVRYVHVSVRTNGSASTRARVMVRVLLDFGLLLTGSQGFYEKRKHCTFEPCQSINTIAILSGLPINQFNYERQRGAPTGKAGKETTSQSQLVASLFTPCRSKGRGRLVCARGLSPLSERSPGHSLRRNNTPLGGTRLWVSCLLAHPILSCMRALRSSSCAPPTGGPPSLRPLHALRVRRSNTSDLVARAPPPWGACFRSPSRARCSSAEGTRCSAWGAPTCRATA